MKRQRVAIVVVVIDDKDAGPSSHRSIVGHRAVPINAGNGTLTSSEVLCSAFPPPNRYCAAERNREPPAMTRCRGRNGGRPDDGMNRSEIF
jgi:hypothetical protein